MSCHTRAARLAALTLALAIGSRLTAADPPAAPDKFGGLQPVLTELGVTVRATHRPRWPVPPASSVEVTLLPQVQEPGPLVVSFGLPFGPDALKNEQLIRVRGEDGKEIAAFTTPLARWGIDGKPGSIRSVLLQFEAAFPDRKPRKVVVTWDKAPAARRGEKVPTADTQTVVKDDGFDFHCPKVVAVLPADWLCASLIVWQQVPAKRNTVAPWFDKYLAEQFPGSLKNIAGKDYEGHLFDRPATYAKAYARHGEEQYLRATLRAVDFYVSHLGADGFFDLKREKDHKYVYAEGPAVAYLLTGDERYKQAVERGLLSWAKWAPRSIYKGEGFWTERHTAFGLAHYLHAYELLGDPKLLDTARRYFEGVLAMQVKPLDGKAPDGAWVHTSDSHGDGNGWTTSPWMSAFLLDSIWKLWMTTGDPRCAASMAIYAKFIEKHGVTPDGTRLYYMANSPERGKSIKAETSHNVEAAYIMALGYYLSGGTEEGMLKKVGTLGPPMTKVNSNSPRRMFTWVFRETSMLVWFLANAAEAGTGASLREVNPPLGPDPTRVIAVVGAKLIDGRGGPPVPDSVVLVRGGAVVAAGPRSAVEVPPGATVVDAVGCSLVPGLIDAHFHVERLYQLPQTFLSHGVTSVRDPGEWIHVFDPVRKDDTPMPRFFLTGPHLDCAPPAHPNTAFVVKGEEDTRAAVTRFVDEGGSAIKVYFRLPTPLIRAAAETAHARRVPVTAHLEIVDADEAVRAGLDGVEHVTSFGTALADPRDAQRFRADVTLDNRARGSGRYALWSKIDLETSPRVKPLIDLLAARKTVVSPTLAVFERRRGDKGVTEETARGFETMLKFVGLCHKAGVPVVVGSHSEVPKAPRGWAYHREMELLVECGLTPMETIVAATRNNAAFFRMSDRLGTVEPGKLADLVLVEGDPTADIRAMRQVKRVMQHGRWVVPAGKGG